MQMRIAGWLALVAVLLIAGCAKMPGTGLTKLRAVDLPDLERQLQRRSPDIAEFRLRGPFTPEVRKNLALRLSDAETVEADLYFPDMPGRTPLVILLHGHENAKEHHAYQAFHLATWGLNALALQLPPEGPWVDNGRLLAWVASEMRRHPETLDARIDASRIVLAGHSYGGAATAIALAEGAPAVGGVLLDAASFGREIQPFLRRVGKPVMLIAADENVARTRGRNLFYGLIPRNVAEISVRDAGHDDGEFPMEPRAGSMATETHQITFVAALTAAAFSLATTGRLDYAWASYAPGLRNGTLIHGTRK